MKILEIFGDEGSPVVVSVPHSGTEIPEEIRKRLAVPVEEAAGRRDLCTRELAQAASEQALVIRARIARAVVDLNRSGAISELDLTADPGCDRERLVRLYDDRGRLLWRSPVGRPPIAREELEERVRRYYDPYHAALQERLERAGRPALLVDLHSTTDPAFDLIIGDFRGRSAGAEICEREIRPFLAGRGYRVGYAGPRDRDRQGRPLPLAAIRHSGGFITSRYGDPEKGRYAFQVEVSRSACRQDPGRMEKDFADFFEFLRGRVESGEWGGEREDEPA